MEVIGNPTAPSFGARLTATEESKAEAINPANSAEQKMADARERRTRIPMSVPRAKLATPELPGFHGHWLNDDGARIAQAIQAGYEFVSQDEALITMPDVAGSPLGQGTDLGSRVSAVVGKKDDGTPMRAYLMKIRSEWYESDQAEHHARVDRMHEAMEQGKQQLESGMDGKHRYVKSINMRSTYSRKG